jgi:hypothetical protein
MAFDNITPFSVLLRWVADDHFTRERVMRKKLEPVISQEVKAIREKLERGERLTTRERKLEVSKDEAAYILSALAGREISANYIKQLTRGKEGKEPRLVPARAIGNTYLYTVAALLGVRFTKAHAPKTEEDTTQQEVEL